MNDINDLLERTGFGLSYYEHAITDAFLECDTVEEALGMERISLRIRFEQLQGLLDRLKTLEVGK